MPVAGAERGGRGAAGGTGGSCACRAQLKAAAGPLAAGGLSAPMPRAHSTRVLWYRRVGCPLRPLS